MGVVLVMSPMVRWTFLVTGVLTIPVGVDANCTDIYPINEGDGVCVDNILNHKSLFVHSLNEYLLVFVPFSNKGHLTNAML